MREMLVPLIGVGADVDRVLAVAAAIQRLTARIGAQDLIAKYHELTQILSNYWRRGHELVRRNFDHVRERRVFGRQRPRDVAARRGSWRRRRVLVDGVRVDHECELGRCEGSQPITTT